MEEFDYIVLGAGTAGCVVTRRLLDQTKARVLLVEAGPGYRGFLHNPPLPGLRFGRKFSWGQKSIPQPRLFNRQIEWPMGKVVGGSSSINAMIVHLGHPANYDQWEQNGNPGWSSKSLAPYFQKVFGIHPGEPYRETDQGMISLSQARHHSAFSNAFLEACQQDGMRCQSPLIEHEQETCGFYPVLQRNGERFESARGYLSSVLRNPRLHLQTGVQVLRVLLSQERAIGIEILERGVSKKLYASAGVIVCAGAFQTPRILQCSGLGPADRLRAAGIKPVLDIPAIGANLHDHLRVEMVFESNRVSPGSLRWWLPESIRYLLQRRGVMVSNCCESGAFLCSHENRHIPDLQLVTHFQTFGGKGRVAIEVCLVDSRSRGRVDLSTTDPYGTPCVDPNFFGDPNDLHAMLAGIRRVRQLAQQPSLRGFPLLGETRPGESLLSDDALTEAAYRNVMTAYHPGGSCAMGADGALDHNLRVRGTQSLWVADASAMPLVPFGNSTCPVLVLAEKASDLILAATR